MIGYIKNPRTFKVVQQVEVLSYDLPLECYSGKKGSVTILPIDKDVSQMLFYLQGYDDLSQLWKIESFSYEDEEKIKLSVTDSTNIFCGIRYTYGSHLVTNSFYTLVSSLLGGSSGYRRLGILEGVSNFDVPNIVIRRLGNIRPEMYWVYQGESYWASAMSDFWSGCTLTWSDVAEPLKTYNGQDYRGIASASRLISLLKRNGFRVKCSVEKIKDALYEIQPLAIGDNILITSTDASHGSLLNTVMKITRESSTAYNSYELSSTSDTSYKWHGRAWSYEGDRNVYCQRSSITSPKSIDELTVSTDYGDKLCVAVEIDYVSEQQTAVPVFFNDGHSELLTSSIGEDDVITATAVISTSNDTVKTHWFYLTENEQITDQKDLQSVGTTSYINPYAYCNTWNDALPLAMEEFAKNVHAQKIEFASDKVLHLGQPVKLMLKRGTLDTAISNVSIKSGDDRFFYTCGELPATAADKISANNWHYGFRAPQNAKKGSLYIV